MLIGGAGALVILLFVLVMAVDHLSRREVAAHGLLLAGGMSNLIDRARWGKVVDYAIFGYGEFRTGIFNAADLAVSIGFVLLLIALANRIVAAAGRSRQRRETRLRAAPICGYTRRPIHQTDMRPP